MHMLLCRTASLGAAPCIVGPMMACGWWVHCCIVDGVAHACSVWALVPACGVCK